MRESKVEALIVIVDAKGISDLDGLFTCITHSEDKAVELVKSFAFNGKVFTEVTPVRNYIARVNPSRLDQVLAGSHHIY